MRRSFTALAAPGVETDDYWQQPSTGKFHEEAVRPAWFQEFKVFTGDRVQGYRLEKLSNGANQAYDFSYNAYMASILENKTDPKSFDQGEIGNRVTEIKQAVASGDLQEVGSETRDGRILVQYEGVVSTTALRRAVLVDQATGFPLEDKDYRADGVLYDSQTFDLEVLDDADVVDLFAPLAFPEGVKVMKDEDLPVSPVTGTEASLQLLKEAAARVSFPLFYLGWSYQQLPLELVNGGQALRTSAPLESVSLSYRGTDAGGLVDVGVLEFDPAVTERLHKPFSGWTVVEKVKVGNQIDVIYRASDAGHYLFYVTLRGNTEIDIYGMTKTGGATASELTEIAKSLVPFP